MLLRTQAGLVVAPYAEARVAVGCTAKEWSSCRKDWSFVVDTSVVGSGSFAVESGSFVADSDSSAADSATDWMPEERALGFAAASPMDLVLVAVAEPAVEVVVAEAVIAHMGSNFLNS